MVEAKYDELGNKIVNDEGSVVFKCPKCGNYEIVRTRQAKSIGKKYVCPKCGFEGP